MPFESVRFFVSVKVKVKVFHYSPGQNLRAPEEFLDNWHIKVLKLQALRTGRLYPPKRYPWYSFLLQAELTPRAIGRP